MYACCVCMLRFCSRHIWCLLYDHAIVCCMICFACCGSSLCSYAAMLCTAKLCHVLCSGLPVSVKPSLSATAVTRGDGDCCACVQGQTCSNYSAHALPIPIPLVHQDVGFHAQAALPPLLLHSCCPYLRPPLPMSPQPASHSPLHLPPSLNKLPSP